MTLGLSFNKLRMRIYVLGKEEPLWRKVTPTNVPNVEGK